MYYLWMCVRLRVSIGLYFDLSVGSIDLSIYRSILKQHIDLCGLYQVHSSRRCCSLNGTTLPCFASLPAASISAGTGLDWAGQSRRRRQWPPPVSCSRHDPHRWITTRKRGASGQRIQAVVLDQRVIAATTMFPWGAPQLRRPLLVVGVAKRTRIQLRR